MKHIKSFIIMMIIMIFSSLQSWSQVPSDKKSMDKAKKAKAGQELVDPSLTSSIRSPALQMVFEGTRDKKTISAQIGIQTPNTSFNLKLRGPIGEKATQAILADLDGLANSVNADIGITQFIWNPTFDQNSFVKVIKKAVKDKKISQEEAEAIDTVNQLPEEYQKMVDINWDTAKLLGLHFLVGREKFEYFEDSTFDVKEASKTNYAIVGNIGIFQPEKDQYVSIAYRYQVSYKVGKKREIYLPLKEVEGALERKELPVGAPLRQISHIGQLEYYRKFFRGFIAIYPKFNYDFKNKIAGLEIPLYFLQSKNKGLNGGVNLGWRSDKKEWTIRLFVGNVLAFF